MVAILYSEINILCILILLLVYFKIKSEPYVQTGQQLFMWVLLSNCVFFAMDALWAFVDSESIMLGITANWLLNILYYIISGVVGFLWFVYSEQMQNSRLVKGKMHILISAIPVLLLTVLTFASTKTGWLFYIDDANVYHRGPLYALQLLCSYGYIVFTAGKALYLSYQTGSYFKRMEYRTLASFVVAPLIAGIIQVAVPGISLLCVGTTFGVLYVFMTMQEQKISVDSLTGLNNRNRMLQHLSNCMVHRESQMRLFVIMMDMDHFKQINDRYGHIEGDRALQRAADALKACCRDQHHFIARYGGDEFIAICEQGEHASVDAFCQSICDELRIASEGYPYTLSLSIGCAEYRPDIKTELDFIKLADAELYKAKNLKKLRETSGQGYNEKGLKS